MIRVEHLTKVYGDHKAVDDISFTIMPGKIYGLLGQNGAGKSTTMNMITGCLAPTEGRVEVCGHDILKEPIAAKRAIGYLPEIPPLYTDMTPREYLFFVAEAKGLAADVAYRQVGEVMELTAITDMADRLIKNLSKGYRQRVGIAQAMLGNPEIIILDEPTVGLDPRQIIEMRDLIRRLGENRTVILSSHILAEISAVCEHVLIISHGKLVADDSIANLEAKAGTTDTIRLSARAEEGALTPVFDTFSEIADYTCHPGRDAGVCDCILHVEKGSDIRDSLFFALAEHKIPVLGMELEQHSLEDVFLFLTEGPGTETPVAKAAPEEGQPPQNDAGDNDSGDDNNTSAKEGHDA